MMLPPPFLALRLVDSGGRNGIWCLQPIMAVSRFLRSLVPSARAQQLKAVAIALGVTVLVGCQSAGVPPYQVLAEDVAAGKAVDASDL